MPERCEMPQDLDAERALLGTLLLGCADFDEAVSIVGTHEAFYVPQHRTIYQIIRDIRDAGEPLDLTVFMDWAQRNKCGDLDRLQQDIIACSESFSSMANAQHYAKIVRGHFERRELIGLGSRLAREAHDTSNDAAELAHRYASRLDTVAGYTQDASCVDAVELVRQLPAHLDNPARGFVETGLTPIDAELGGLERGELTVVAARPSIGKTAIGLAFAVHAAQGDTPSLFVSVEMPRMAIAARIVSLLAGLSAHRLRNGLAGEAERASAIEQTAKLLSSGRLWVSDSISNARDIVAVSRQHIRRYRVGLVVVDYLQLCQPGERTENRNLAVASMSAAFKQLAMKTGAAVIVLSQLSRDPAKSGRMPNLSDLRDSGAIEQDADVVLLLHRDDDHPAGDTIGVQCRVAKNRNSPTCDFTLGFHRPTMRFQNYRIGA